MRFHVVVCLLSLLAVAGCRQLVEVEGPADSADDWIDVQFEVLLPDGLRDDRVRFVLSNEAYVERDYFSVRVPECCEANAPLAARVPRNQPLDLRLDDWSLGDVVYVDGPLFFDGPTATIHLDPVPMRLEWGTAGLGVPVEAERASCECRIPRPGQTTWLYASDSINLTRQPEPVWLVKSGSECRFRITGTIAGGEFDWNSGFVDAERVVSLELPFVPVLVSLELGGQPFSGRGVRLETHALPQSVGVVSYEFPSESTWPRLLWMLPGLNRIVCSPRAGATDFYSHSIYVDVVSEAEIAVDLGRHRLSIDIRTAAGDPVPRGVFRLGTNGYSFDSYRSSDETGHFEVYVDGGDLLVTIADAENLHSKVYGLVVDSDLDLTLQLAPY